MVDAGNTERVMATLPLQESSEPRSTKRPASSVNVDTNGFSTHEPGTERSSDNKRRRTGLACSACRTRKTRCDGSRPTCSACENQGYQCIYAQPAYSDNVMVGRDHLFTLESRLSILERKFKSLEQQTCRQTPLQLQLATERTNDNWQAEDTTRVIVDDEAVPELLGLDDPTDAMGAMVFTEEEDFGFFGPSSNIAFTRHISQAVARVTQSRQTWATPGTEESFKFAGRMTRDTGPASPVRRPQRMEPPKEGDVNIYFIPTEKATRSLMSSYFAYIGTLYPYIHEATFIETYKEMKRNNFRKARRIWLGLFNMVLALASIVPYRSDVTVEQRTERANDFYQRALSLCKELMMRGTSLEVVQFLLLVGQYLQGTRQSLQTWTIHGLAVKAALQLGLHSSEALKRFPPLDREIRKRTWYGCILLDRTLSMTFGRPPTIHEDYIRLDLPTYYPENLSSDNPPDTNEVISLEFYNATIKLYKIMGRAIELLYGSNVGSNLQSDVFTSIADLFALEQQLSEWKGSLPSGLVLRESPELSEFGQGNLSAWERSRIILTLRYHNVRILVHRLVLVRFLEMAGKDDLDEQQFALLKQIGLNSVQICMRAASEIISIVYEVVHSTGIRRTLLGAWWFTVYYAFNASLVIFSGLLIQKVFDCDPSFSGGIGATRKTLANAAAAVRYIDVGNRMAEKCSKYVEQLGHLVDLLGRSSHPRCPFQIQNLLPIYINSGARSSPYVQTIPTLQSESNCTTTSNTLYDQAAFDTTVSAACHDTYVSPLGMGFGDFIVGDDIDFLNTFFDTWTTSA